jgi:hypothetical protein
MPTPVEFTILAIFISIALPGIQAYGKLRDEMATLRAEIVSLKVEDARNAKDIQDESHRNDLQDASLGTMRETLARIDSNVQRLVDNESDERRKRPARVTNLPGH